MVFFTKPLPEEEGQAEEFPFLSPDGRFFHGADDQGDPTTQAVDVPQVVQYLHQQEIPGGGIAGSDLLQGLSSLGFPGLFDRGGARGGRAGTVGRLGFFDGGWSELQILDFRRREQFFEYS